MWTGTDHRRPAAAENHTTGTDGGERERLFDGTRRLPMGGQTVEAAVLRAAEAGVLTDGRRQRRRFLRVREAARFLRARSSSGGGFLQARATRVAVCSETRGMPM